MNAATMHELWDVVSPTLHGELHTGDKVLVKMSAIPPGLFIAAGFPTPSDFQIMEDQFAFALEEQIAAAKQQYAQHLMWGTGALWGAEHLARINTWRKLRVIGVASVLDSFGQLHVYAQLLVEPNPAVVVWVIWGVTASVVAVSAAVIVASQSAASVFASWELIAADSVRIVESLSSAAPDSPAGDVADAAKNVSFAMVIGAAALALLVFKVKFK